MVSSMLTSPLPPSFLDTYNLSTSSPGCNALCKVIFFFCSLVHLFEFFSGTLIELSRVYYEGGSLGIYSFDKVSSV